MTAKSLRSPPYPPALGTPWHMYMCVCVCEFTPPARRNVASCNIFVASSTDFRSLFHLPNVWHVHSRRCCNCATATARQLDARARQPPELRLRLDCQQSVVAAIDLRFEYPKLAHFRVSVSRPYILTGTHPPDVGYKVTLIASTSDTRLRSSSSSNKRPVTRVWPMNCVKDALWQSSRD